MSDSRKLTTGHELQVLVQNTPTSTKTLPGYEGQNVLRYQLGVCMDEVYPNIYIGDLGAAKNKGYLKKVGVTHVVNTAQGKNITNVNTNADFYKDFNIEYMGLELLDFPSANIEKYFQTSAEFIEQALKSGGKVLIHCYMGISRSATITAAFLMIKRGLTAREALETLKKNRSVYPNEGFLNQLADLDNALSSQRKGT